VDDTGSQSAVWASPSWRGQAVAWLDAQLEAAGIRRTADVEQPHLRPWATVLKAETTHGVVWLKAAAPGTAFEVGLYELLSRAAPDRVLIPIASDVARGWIVLPDGGPALADRLPAAETASAMAVIMRRYGELQRRLEPEVERALALGVADMRPTIMPARLDEAIEGAAALVERRDDDAGRATLHGVRAMRDSFATWCSRLAAAPGVATPGTRSSRTHVGPRTCGSTTGATPWSRTRSRACSSRSR